MFPFIKTLKRNEVLTGLRANFKNRHFARNREAGFTGIFQKSTFCP
ncbi:hypothetical protein LRU_02006 [Ligilactobacillus ruminis SPM0211]|uniref:Uncharacterized protein n=1 Tax=Ligilactobacillus ruminis SPM0211 TaxID=1040964 RepID=F7R2Q8_9LACO|nr:hypothetical protein LRU_02006 [Ligilactobacillus ruminis SPM0211]